ncbi:hypothetical protein LEMLEM_LOCUS5018 [Lemmus lemmus]
MPARTPSTLFPTIMTMLPGSLEMKFVSCSSMTVRSAPSPTRIKVTVLEPP